MDWTLSISDLLKLNKDDEIEIAYYHTVGTNSTPRGGTGSIVYIRRDDKSALSAVPVPRTVHLKDIKGSGAFSGGFTSGAYQTRTLNTITGDTSFCSLSGNQFTLESGQYELEGYAPGFACDAHKCQLYNVTDAAVEELGSGEWSDATNLGQATSKVFTRVELLSSKTFELRHRCSATKASNGFGAATAFGDSEVYAQLKITKVK